VAVGSSGIESLTDVPRGFFVDKLTDCRASAACSVHAWTFAATSMFEDVAADGLMTGTTAVISQVEMLRDRKRRSDGGLYLISLQKTTEKQTEDHQVEMMGDDQTITR
jgi:hypothetical protein